MPDSAEIIRRVHDELPAEAQERWTRADIQTIAQTVAPGLNAGELKMLLSIAGKYDLDPLLHEIWGAKGRSKNGEPGRLLIMVGRDGLLRNARRQEGYAGFDGDVVRKNDTFKVARLPDGQRQITHVYEGGAEERGEILGAWAQVYVHGRSSVYYFAPYSDYKPIGPNRAWDNTPGLMIAKCALSLALRLAFNMSGVLGEEEAARAIEQPSEAMATSSLSEVVDQLPAALQQRVYDAYGKLRDAGAAISPEQIRMAITGQSEEDQAAYVVTLESWADSLAEQSEVVDAEIVDQAPDPTNVDRLAELEARRNEIQENPGTETETLEALAEINAEIDALQGQLSLGASDE